MCTEGQDTAFKGQQVTARHWKSMEALHKGISWAVNGSFTVGFDQYKNKVDVRGILQSSVQNLVHLQTILIK